MNVDDGGDPETPLAARHCVPCEGGTPALDADGIAALLPRVPAWTLHHDEQGDELVRELRFRDFLEAAHFVAQVTPAAEAEGHHPDLLVSWGRVAVHLRTHAVDGLTANDFILAARIDQLGS